MLRTGATTAAAAVVAAVASQVVTERVAARQVQQEVARRGLVLVQPRDHADRLRRDTRAAEIGLGSPGHLDLHDQLGARARQARVTSAARRRPSSA